MYLRLFFGNQLTLSHTHEHIKHCGAHKTNSHYSFLDLSFVFYLPLLVVVPDVVVVVFTRLLRAFRNICNDVSIREISFVWLTKKYLTVNFTISNEADAKEEKNFYFHEDDEM